MHTHHSPSYSSPSYARYVIKAETNIPSSYQSRFVCAIQRCKLFSAPLITQRKCIKRNNLNCQISLQGSIWYINTAHHVLDTSVDISFIWWKGHSSVRNYITYLDVLTALRVLPFKISFVVHHFICMYICGYFDASNTAT